MEGLQPHHHQHGQGAGVRGRRHRAVPPPGHQGQQSGGGAGGLLPQQPAQHHQPPGHRAGLPGRHLLPGLPRGPGDQAPEGAGVLSPVPHQALLHVQHAHHPADLPGVEPLLLLAAPLQAVQVQPARQPPGTVAGHGERGAVDPRGRARLLHLAAGEPQQGHRRPRPRLHIHRLHPLHLRPFLKDVGRGQRLLQPRRGQAAQGAADGHEGLPRLVAGARARPLHPHCCGVRRHVHRDAIGAGGLPRRHRVGHGHPPGRDHHLPALRDHLQGTRARSCHLLVTDQHNTEREGRGEGIGRRRAYFFNYSRGAGLRVVNGCVDVAAVRVTAWLIALAC
mmetsp:Transcript_45881/g.114087  ORF Transcript_45881/g.114087 Transcript_45881/m.114087 type:complete len:335 (+) Transcript_45881:760-1764(+)